MKHSESIEILKAIIGSEKMADILLAFSRESKEVRSFVFPPFREIEASRKEECITHHLKLREEQKAKYQEDGSEVSPSLVYDRPSQPIHKEAPWTIRQIAELCGCNEKEVWNIQRRAERKEREADRREVTAFVRVVSIYTQIVSRREVSKEVAKIKRGR